MNSGVLNRLRLRLAGWLLARVALALPGAMGAVALFLFLGDAVLDFSDTLRSMAPWLLAASAVGILALGFRQWRRLDDRGVAGLFERREPALGDRLTNAVQLASRRGASSIEEYLRREAVQLGQTSAARLQAWPIMRRSVKWAAGGLGLVILMWLGMLGWGGDAWQAVLPRFVDPRGDHPPYSKLKFEVMPGRTEVLFGGQVEVRATLRGRPVDKLWLVTRTATNVSRTIMFLAPDQSFFQTLANLREPAEYFVTDGQARSRRFPIGLRYTPQITLVEMSMVFPDYTGKPARKFQSTDEPQSLPAGTRVQFRVASNRPLQSGTLTLTPVLGGKPSAIVLHPAPEQDSLVSGGFTLSEAVAFLLSVRDVGGLDCAEPRRGRFNIRPDERPRIFVLEPGRDAVATPRIRVPIKVQAQDDYGITRVVWLRGHNRSIERPFNMKMTLKSGPQSVESAGLFELEQLGVKPGDVIEYYFEAADNDPTGPNVALSRLYKLDIISEEQYQSILKQAAARKALFEPYFKMDAWMRRLAERAREAQAKAEKSDPATRADAEELAEQLENYERELARLMESPALFDVEESFRATLATQQAQVGGLKQALKKSLSSGPLGPSQLKPLAKALSELARTAQEQMGQPAQQIAAVVQVVSRADTFVRLAQQQAALAQMLRRFADHTNALSRVEQIEVQELAHQQKQIEEALRTLLTQLPELLAKVPEEPDYAPLRKDVSEFLKAIAEAKIEQDLHDAAQVLAEPDTMTGHVLASQAAGKMARLIGKCQGMPKKGQQCLTAHFAPKLSKQGLGEAVQQIMSALNSGNGQGGRDGYSMANNDLALYGPNVELAGEQGGGRKDEGDNGPGGGRQMARVTGDTREAGRNPPEAPGRVRLQPDAKFPLRYRELVGEYFRSIAEGGPEGEKR